MSLKLDRLPQIVLSTFADIQRFYGQLQIWWQKQAKAVEDHELIQDALIEGLDATDDALALAVDEIEQTQIDLAEAQADLEDTVDDLAAAQAEIDTNSTTLSDHATELADHETRIDAAEAAAPTYALKNQATGWTAPSGTLSRATFAAYAGQTVSNPPTQAQVQAIDDHVKLLSQRVAAALTDLIGPSDIFTT